MLWKSHAALTNARQLTKSFQSLSQRQQTQSLSWRFRPFWPLESNQVSAHNLQQIEGSIRSGYYNESVLKIFHFIVAILCLFTDIFLFWSQ